MEMVGGFPAIPSSGPCIGMMNHGGVSPVKTWVCHGLSENLDVVQNSKAIYSYRTTKRAVFGGYFEGYTLIWNQHDLGIGKANEIPYFGEIHIHLQTIVE